MTGDSPASPWNPYGACSPEVVRNVVLAEALARTEDTSSSDSLLPGWLLSLGQDREVEVELAEQIREGRYAVIISGVDTDSDKEAIVDMLQQNGAQGINVLGTWQNEEVL